MRKLIQKPHCIGFRMFADTMSAVAMQKLTAKIISRRTWDSQYSSMRSCSCISFIMIKCSDAGRMVKRDSF